MTIAADLRASIAALHTAARPLVYAFAGAGSQALWWLHALPGSSKTVVEALDCYAPAALAAFVGHAPDKAVSEATAAAMAERAYRRAQLLTDGHPRALGLACTAAIATDRQRHGADHAWIATRDAAELRLHYVTLDKALHIRETEEASISRLVVRAACEAAGVTAPDLLLGAGDALRQQARPAPDPLADVLAGRSEVALALPDGSLTAAAPPVGAIFSGAFNPLHAGHVQLADAAATLLAAPLTYELAVVNADKPPLSAAEVLRRVAQFRGYQTVALSRAPLFAQKAALYPGSTFVLGYDTAARLIDPRYYGGLAGRDAALAQLRAYGCRVLVAGRLDGAVFRTLADLPLPPTARDLFLELPERLFRLDLSSTAIRAARRSD